MEEMQAQAEHVGTKVVWDHVSAVDLSSRPFRLTGDGGAQYFADALVIATGAQAKYLGLPSEEHLKGRGSLGLRDLRRLFLSRQEGRGDRRRQHRGRGSLVHDQPQS